MGKSILTRIRIVKIRSKQSVTIVASNYSPEIQAMVASLMTGIADAKRIASDDSCSERKELKSKLGYTKA